VPTGLGLPLGLSVCEAALLRDAPPELLPSTLLLPSREALSELLPQALPLGSTELLALPLEPRLPVASTVVAAGDTEAVRLAQPVLDALLLREEEALRVKLPELLVEALA
jgi:hypothetical protein